MSQSYEMMYILRPDRSEEQVRQQVGEYRDFLNERGVQDIKIKIWGKRRLAYPIKKYFDGIYVQMNYQADGKQVAPLERAMRLSDEVIRYLTIKTKQQSPAAPESKAAEAPDPVEPPETVPVEA